ncbi:hypothetical protein ABZY31_24105 [Streptomyces sp. NPDC006529]|uniref:hypothetical protein n=1 Tax=Streptomyces sp. NPDC006529 TaxID=3157177 RepID=UPI0033A0F849
MSLFAALALTALVPVATASAADPTDCVRYRTSDSKFLAVGERLDSGTSLVPTPGKPELVMQPDGNLVIYAVGNIRPDLPLWNSGTYGYWGAYALMQEDGNFVIYKKDGGPGKGGAVWASGTYGTRTDTTPRAWFVDWGELEVIGRSDAVPSWRTATINQSAMICPDAPDRITGFWYRGNWAESASVWLVLQHDNNLVMYRKRDGQAIWNSGTYGPAGGYNGSVLLQMERTGNLNVREFGPNFTIRWHTGTAGSDGAYALLQDDGNFVVYKKDGGPGKGGALWASGTYNKI